MKKAPISLLLLLLISSCCCLVSALRPELVLEKDDRKVLPVASFGFLSGGQLSIDLKDFQLSDPKEPGVVAFYIRKGRHSIIEETGGVARDESPEENDDDDERSLVHTCFLDYSYVKDEVDDGSSIIKEIPIDETTWQTSMTVGPTEAGLWQVLFVNCKQRSTMSFRLSIEEINPGNNHLSAGDTPLSIVYGVSALAYLLAALYWLRLLLLRKDTRVFRAHWFMLILVVCVFVNKALQSAKFYYTKIGVLTEGWRIGFYIFASLKGILSILIIVLLASGWMFIKPFLSTKDKRVISVVVPLQVLANIASAIGNEAALGSTDKSFWTTLLPLIDLAGCAVILWTILQTRKHLGTASAADGKEVDILNKYKLWSSFYIVTLVYIYVTRIIVQLLQASLSFKYVTWLGEAVDEVATLLFYVFIGYKFRPFPNNPYTQVPDEDFDEENDASYRSGGGGADAAEDNSLRMYPISRTRNISDKTSKNHSTDSL